MEKSDRVHEKIVIEFLEKITVYPNEAIHDDCVVAFSGGYEKIVSEAQTRRINAVEGSSSYGLHIINPMP